MGDIIDKLNKTLEIFNALVIKQLNYYGKKLLDLKDKFKISNKSLKAVYNEFISIKNLSQN